MTPVTSVRVLFALGILSLLLVGRARAQSNDQLIMAWTGQSEMGYLRVELWTPDAKEPGVSRLVIKSATLAGVTTHTGRLITLPDDIRTDPVVQQLFVASPDDITRNVRRVSPVVATISLEGTLRLYMLGPCEFRTPATLKPI